MFSSRWAIYVRRQPPLRRAFEVFASPSRRAGFCGKRGRMADYSTLTLLSRIAEALERLAPPAPPPPDFAAADAFVWHADADALGAGAARQPGRHRAAAGHRPGARHRWSRTRSGSPRACPPTTRCCGARAAWASRSLVKAAHAAVNARKRRRAPAEADRDPPRGHREPAAPDGARCARDPHRFLVFCDDLSFDGGDTSYKSLKAALEGGVEGRPENVLFYATSNRRHLLPRDMMENERSTAINPGEAVEEKVSLSDRFGLWLGFHKCSQDDYLDDGARLCRALRARRAARRRSNAEALEWATTRGWRSGPHGLAVHPGSCGADGRCDRRVEPNDGESDVGNARQGRRNHRRGKRDRQRGRAPARIAGREARARRATGGSYRSRRRRDRGGRRRGRLSPRRRETPRGSRPGSSRWLASASASSTFSLITPASVRFRFSKNCVSTTGTR